MPVLQPMSSATCSFDFEYEDTPPGEVQRMSKTKVDRGVWAAAKALVYHHSFPTLLDATYGNVRPQSSSPSTKFKYNWRQWLTNLNDSDKFPHSCERMVRILQERFGYEKHRMLLISTQLSKAVIELVYRNAEKQRKVDISSLEVTPETTLMTRVRASCSHKTQPVEEFIRRVIQCWYPSSSTISPVSPRISPQLDSTIDQPFSGVTDASAFPPQIPADLFTAQPLESPMLFSNQQETFNIEHIFDGSVTDLCLLPPTATDSSFLESSPPATASSLVHILEARKDPLVTVMVLCQLRDNLQAVTEFKRVLNCSDQALTSICAKNAGLTPWHFMWLELGKLIAERENYAASLGKSPTPSTLKLLCELDSVFELIECEREYGEFTPEAIHTLNEGVKNGNFAAMATKGLLLLGGDAHVVGCDVSSFSPGKTEEELADEGLKLVVKAMKYDVWTVPRLLAELVQNLSGDTLKHDAVERIVNALKDRAKTCSIASLHLGTLLADETPIHNIREAKDALRSCLDGVDVPRDIRIHCLRKLGRLLTFGIGGKGIELNVAENILEKGAEAEDAICIAYLANLRLRQRKGDDAVNLFRKLFRKDDEREVYVSSDMSSQINSWVTYRIHVQEVVEQHFLSNVRAGACFPDVMREERAKEYGDLMVIELHEYGL